MALARRQAADREHHRKIVWDEVLSPDPGRFPLDWIIDWSTACFRISAEEVADGSYRDRLDEILNSPLTEVNRRRAYIFRIYHQFMAPERKEVFEQLVLLRVRELIRDGLGQAAPSVR